MKKLAVSALALLLVCSLSACGGDGEGTDTSTGDESYKVESTTAPSDTTATPVVTDAVTTTEAPITTEEPADTTTAPSSITFTAADVMVYALGSVNIRSTPSASDGKILATLNYGESLRCVGTSENWYKVIYGDKECYVSAAYLTTDNLNLSLEDRNETVYIIVDVATVRRGPSTSTEAIAYLNKGASLIRTGISAEWSRVSYDGGSYYIHNSCLDTNKAS